MVKLKLIIIIIITIIIIIIINNFLKTFITIEEKLYGNAWRLG